MADFGFFSDTDESAVEDLISQAQDLCVLDQVSKINCSSFSESLLPTDLETRFHKLKSFPLSTPKSSKSKLEKSFSNPTADFAKTVHGSVSIDDDTKIFSPNKIFSETKQSTGEEEKVFTKTELSLDSQIDSAIQGNPDGNKGSFMDSPMGFSSNLSEDSDSPPLKSGCFWCSPKKVSKKKKKENWDFDWINNNDEFLSDLNLFTVKEQEKILRKAMKEEEKINREAEKIVKWAKQASGRMNFQGVDDNNDNFK